MTRDEYLSKNPIDAVCASRGIKLIGQGNERKALCPLHKDRKPSFSVNIRKGLWTCYAGCGGGSVIDLLSKLDGVSIREFCVREGIGKNGESSRQFFSNSRSLFKRKSEPEPKKKTVERNPEAKSEIDKIYSYQDALGREAYQVVRFKPKDFRQRHREDGEWVWNMQNVERVLYHLPEVLQSPSIWVVEGEKDADSLIALGFMATTNVGGAGKWLDSYSDTLKGKDVAICGDNDETREDGSNPGQDHVRQVFDSIAGKAKTVKIVTLPKTVKDVSEFIATFKESKDAKHALEQLRDEAHSFVQGIELPVYTVSELQPRLIRHFQEFDDNAFYLSKWLPGLKCVGPLIPGDMVVLMGDTGSGKTGMASSLTLAALPLPTLFCELELSVERLLTRLIATRSHSTREEVKNSYLRGTPLSEEDIEQHFKNLYICPKAKLTVDEIERIITRSELKIGSKPRVVVIDYIQLLQGRGERYERMSDAVEKLRVIAKATQSILILVSQVHRPKDGETEIGKYSGKDSGAIENSASVLLGMWRDPKEKNLMHLKVLKNNEGESGRELLCNFDGERMLISERAKVSDEDVPAPKERKAKEHKAAERAPDPYKDE